MQEQGKVAPDDGTIYSVVTFRAVPDYYRPGLLRVDPEEHCDPRFAELNAQIARSGPAPRGSVRAERLEEAAARMRARNAEVRKPKPGWQIYLDELRSRKAPKR